MASRHPKGLYVLFFTEMWERFGFYLMLSLFTMYLNEKRGWTEEEAFGAYGWYMFFVYLTPFPGGILADKIVGYRRAVLTGAALLGIGYLLLGHPEMAGFYAGLVVLVVGNGLFKPNISTLVGNLYPQGDGRRDSAFSIFYMGINIGAGFAGPVGGLMRQHFGWAAAFATAGAGMFISFAIFALFRKHLEIADQRSSVSAVLDVPLGPDYEDRPDPPEVEKQRIIALAIMCGIVMMFWMAFHQNGSTLTIWARDNTIRSITILGWSHEFKPEDYQAVNSIFIVMLTPVITGLMSWLRQRGLEPSTPAKIGIGMLFTAGAYTIMVLASMAGGNTGCVSMWWLIGCYFVITIGELFVSPMGLSMVTKLAPRRMTSMLMGLWFISTSLGNWFSGRTGKWFWKSWTHAQFFSLLVVTSLVAAVVLLTQYRRLKAAMPPEQGTRAKAASDPNAVPVAAQPATAAT